MDDLEKRLVRHLEVEARSRRVSSVRTGWAALPGSWYALLAVPLVLIAVIGLSSLPKASGVPNAVGVPSSASVTDFGHLKRPVCSIDVSGHNAVISYVREGGGPCDAYLSRDGGATWAALQIPPGASGSAEGASALAFDPTDESIYVGTSTGRIFHVLADGTWVLSYEALPNTPFPAVRSFALDGGRVYAGLTGVLMLDEPSGWRDISSEIPGLSKDPTLRGRLHVLGLSAQGSTVTVTFGGSVPTVGVWQSRDRGDSWVKLDSYPSQPTILVRGPGVLVVGASRGTLSRDGSAAPAVWVSRDDGATWSAANSGAERVAVLSLATLGGAVIAGTTDGVLLLDEALHWQRVADLDEVNELVVVGDDVYAGGLFGAKHIRLSDSY